MRIITNSNNANDSRMKKVILDQATEGSSILIASAFFTEHSVLKILSDRGCEIKMIVRLNIGTSPKALEIAHKLKNVNIRFFTGDSFHPKFYILGGRVAYVGSSNFTFKGLMTNQEVNIKIDEEEEAFSDLVDIFYSYWDAAQPLEAKDIKIFKAIESAVRKPNINQQIFDKIGKVEFDNVGLEKRKKTSRQDFINIFKRRYQLYLNKFEVLTNLFTDIGLRRFPTMPLRIEIDRFLWWIREYHATLNSYDGVEPKNEQEILNNLKELVAEFNETDNRFLREEAIHRYEVVAENFSSSDRINSLSTKELKETLQFVHAFSERLRYFPGGWDTLFEEFTSKNSIEQIKTSFVYLLFGDEDYESRIYETTHGKYRLMEFGPNSVSELFGLVNSDGIPVLNGRTIKSMEWLGFGKL